MQSEPKYESLDIEQLLLHKSYYELADDEREFAMQHLDSEQEYEDMRKTLLNISFSSESEELIAPPPRIKEELMAAFDEESDKKPIVIWLNGVNAKLFPDGKSFYRQPGFQAAIAAMIVVAFLVLKPTDDPSIVGHDMVASNESQQAPADEKMVATDSTILEETEETDTRTNLNANLLVADAENGPGGGEITTLSPDQQPPTPPALDDSEVVVADMVAETDEEFPARELASGDAPAFDPSVIANERNKDGNTTNPQGTTGTTDAYYETDNLAQDFDFEFKGKVTSVQTDSVSYDRFRADGMYKLDNVEDEIAANRDENTDDITFDADDIAFAQTGMDAEKAKMKKEQQELGSLGGVRGGNSNPGTNAASAEAVTEQPNALLELAAQSADKTNKHNAQQIETTAEIAEAEVEVEAEEEVVRLEDNTVSPASTSTTISTSSVNRNRPAKAAEGADAKNTDLIKGRSLNDDKALIKTFFTAL